ncbi:ubiquitin binding protein [Tuber magnatum]|uniref:Vacuolar protein sorting-associated protein 27 n=1 Tax=Tuber magnatum TaxID=42249 RepID=A0A317T2J4_9PEZI|nr:ubiquitin binding protein [Tuber magnatum]
MAWFTASNSSLDDQVEKATSSSLEDMALNLEISDIIRSKTVQPKEAMRSLRKRIGHRNPNVQLAALSLTDTCVKNGGPHFLAEIASREFVDNLVSLLKAPYELDPKVESKILELIQTWASAFEGRSHLSYVGEIYRMLKNEGFNFPLATKVSSSFVDSSAPPDWTDSDVCMRCRTPFTFTNRKHHCRNCGNVFCGACSLKSIPLPHIGIIQAVRVCDGCHTKLTEKRVLGPSAKSQSRSPQVQKQKPNSLMQPRNARVEDDDDEDLKMALKMSLEEVKGKGSVGYVSQQQLQAQKQVAPPHISASTVQPSAAQPSGGKPVPDDDEDEELKAAIAASLKDMEEQKAKSAWSSPNAAVKYTASASQASVTHRPDHELSPAEAENINLFATLVDRLQSQPTGTILREPQIQELYDSIGALRPKLARTFGETMSKYEALCDLHAKLGTVVRYYDRMLEERLSYTYGRHGIGGVSSPAPYQQPPSSSSSYPTLPPAEGYYGVGGGNVPGASQNSYPNQQTNYQNYYTQPHAFDKQGSSLHAQSPESHKALPQSAYQQFNGYSGPPPSESSAPGPSLHSSEPPVNSPPPQQQQQPQSQPQPQQPLAGPSAQPQKPHSQQHHPPPQQSPDASYWQYPKNGQQPEYNYAYSPSPQSPQWQHGPSTGPGGTPYGHRSYGYSNISEASTPAPVLSQPQQQPKVVEESLIDL